MNIVYGVIGGIVALFFLVVLRLFRTRRRPAPHAPTPAAVPQAGE